MSSLFYRFQAISIDFNGFSTKNVLIKSLQHLITLFPAEMLNWLLCDNLSINIANDTAPLTQIRPFNPFQTFQTKIAFFLFSTIFDVDLKQNHPKKGYFFMTSSINFINLLHYFRFRHFASINNLYRRFANWSKCIWLPFMIKCLCPFSFFYLLAISTLTLFNFSPKILHKYSYIFTAIIYAIFSPLPFIQKKNKKTKRFTIYFLLNIGNIFVGWCL